MKQMHREISTQRLHVNMDTEQRDFQGLASVSELKRSFERKYSASNDEFDSSYLKDLPESEASFSNEIQQTSFVKKQNNIDSDKYFDHSSEIGSVNNRQDRNISVQAHWIPTMESSITKNNERRNHTLFSQSQNETVANDDELPLDDEDTLPSTEGDSIDSDEIALSRAALAVLSDRAKREKSSNGLSNKIIHSIFDRPSQTEAHKIEVGKLITGSIDVELPESESNVEVTEVINAVRINNEKDILPVSITGLDSVTVSGTSFELIGRTNHSDSDTKLKNQQLNYNGSNLIKVDSRDYSNKNKVDSNTFETAKNIVRIPSNDENYYLQPLVVEKQEMKVNSRRSLTDSEELKRKASSLGDLSQIPDNQEDSILERAVSLEFQAHGEGNISSISNAHRIDLQNATSIDKEDEQVSVLQMNSHCGPSSSIKKSAMWGTLEDAIQLRHNSSDDSLTETTNKSAIVQNQRRRDHRASSLEGLPYSIGRSNSTKLMVHQPHVTVRSNPTLSLSTADVTSTNSDFTLNSKNEFNSRTLGGGPVSNIEISDGHGVSITSLTHSPWADAPEHSRILHNTVSNAAHESNGATTIRVIENYTQPDSKILVVDTNLSSEQKDFGVQFNSSGSSLTVSPSSFVSDRESEVTVTTVSGSGKTSFITGSSTPDLVPVQKLTGEWNHVNGDVVRVNSDGHVTENHTISHNLLGKLGDISLENADRKNKRDNFLDSGSFKINSDGSYASSNSMTQIMVDGPESEYLKNDIARSQTMLIPPPGTSAAISITQPDSPPPFLERPH